MTQRHTPLAATGLLLFAVCLCPRGVAAADDERPPERSPAPSGRLPDDPLDPRLPGRRLPIRPWGPPAPPSLGTEDALPEVPAWPEDDGTRTEEPLPAFDETDDWSDVAVPGPDAFTTPPRPDEWTTDSATPDTDGEPFLGATGLPVRGLLDERWIDRTGGMNGPAGEFARVRRHVHALGTNPTLATPSPSQSGTPRARILEVVCTEGSLLADGQPGLLFDTTFAPHDIGDGEVFVGIWFVEPARSAWMPPAAGGFADPDGRLTVQSLAFRPGETKAARYASRLAVPYAAFPRWIDAATYALEARVQIVLLEGTAGGRPLATARVPFDLAGLPGRAIVRTEPEPAPPPPMPMPVEDVAASPPVGPLPPPVVRPKQRR